MLVKFTVGYMRLGMYPEGACIMNTFKDQFIKVFISPFARRTLEISVSDIGDIRIESEKIRFFRMKSFH